MVTGQFLLQEMHGPVSSCGTDRGDGIPISTTRESRLLVEFRCPPGMGQMECRPTTPTAQLDLAITVRQSLIVGDEGDVMGLTGPLCGSGGSGQD